MTQTILLDVDGLLADCATQVYRAARRLLKRKLPKPSEWTSYDFSEAMKLTRSESEYFERALKRENNLGWKIEFSPGAANFVEFLHGTGRKIVFVTAPWYGLEHWVEARQHLLQPFLARRNFDVVFTHAKHLVAGDWLVDDHYENIAQNRERGILFVQPWNARYRAMSDYVAESYVEVIETIGGEEEWVTQKL